MPPSASTMRALVWLSTSALLLGAAPMEPVSGTITIVEPWCGGARPPPGRETVRVPDDRPWLIKPGARNTVVKPQAEVTPARGRFTVQLPPGTWCFVPKERSALPPSELRRQAPDGGARAASAGSVNLGCLDAVWGECAQVITVGGDAGTPGAIEVFDYRPCDWTAAARCSTEPVSAPP